MVLLTRRCLAAASARMFLIQKRLQSTLQASKMQITRTQKPKPLVPLKDLVFGKTFSDHMLMIPHDTQIGWHAPRIQPYAPLELDPSATVFHYGMECFEGMKAYKDRQGQIRLFRPDMNMKRFYRSCERLTLPTFDPQELLKCIQNLLKVEERWIPSERGYSLYLRPTMIATQPSLGVGPSAQSLLFVIASPVGPYYKTGFAAVSLLADPINIRAWPGGVGQFKVGGNYAPGILPQRHAAEEGFQQNLWLFPHQQDHLLTEVGTMNLFLLWRSKQTNDLELVTPALDGTILPGVTRDSILHLTREWKAFKVSERAVTMRELVEASDEGRLVEMFGAGTAAIVSPIKRIRYVMERDAGTGQVKRFKDIQVPLDPVDPDAQAGPLARRLSDTIMKIQYGETEGNVWSHVVV